jgi:hypothetical protein
VVRGGARWFVLTVLTLIPVVGLPAVAAGASASTGSTMTITGALKGHLTTPATDCEGTTSKSGEIDFYSQPLKGGRTTGWSMLFTAPHNGTWHPSGIAGSSSFSMQSSAGISQSWTAKSGSFTTKGSSGSVKIILKPQIGSSSHALVDVKGTWNCS